MLLFVLFIFEMQIEIVSESARLFLIESFSSTILWEFINYKGRVSFFADVIVTDVFVV